MLGYRTPNIDRIATDGAMFTCWYAQQSCTAGRAAFITGQSPIRTGLTKVGTPGADIGLRPEDPTVAEVVKNLGYATGRFGKNHLGDKDEFLPTKHGFDGLVLDTRVRMASHCSGCSAIQQLCAAFFGSGCFAVWSVNSQLLCQLS